VTLSNTYERLLVGIQIIISHHEHRLAEL
jgi:hypothetical protein